MENNTENKKPVIEMLNGKTALIHAGVYNNHAIGYAVCISQQTDRPFLSFVILDNEDNSIKPGKPYPGDKIVSVPVGIDFTDAETFERFRQWINSINPSDMFDTGALDEETAEK